MLYAEHKTFELHVADWLFELCPQISTKLLERKNWRIVLEILPKVFEYVITEAKELQIKLTVSAKRNFMELRVII